MWAAPLGGPKDGACADLTKEGMLCSAEEGVSTNKTLDHVLEIAVP